MTVNKPNVKKGGPIRVGTVENGKRLKDKGFKREKQYGDLEKHMFWSY